MVKRYNYDQGTSTTLVEDDCGEFVTHEDYEDLKKSYDKVLEKLAEVASEHLSEGARYYMWKEMDND